ncbi:MAG: 2Fe-2S iron-sulfur cluster-binding protein [Burkholderiales bacterium]
MITIHFISQGSDAQPHEQAVQAKPGMSLMQAAVDADIDGVKADCGGMLTCATCHVLIEPAWLGLLPPITSEESEMLDFAAAPREPGSRLSCQIPLTSNLDGLRVGLPTTQY